MQFSEAKSKSENNRLSTNELVLDVASDDPGMFFGGVFTVTSYVRRFLRLALLVPPSVDAILLTKLDTTLPYSWKEQMELFGMA